MKKSTFIFTLVLVAVALIHLVLCVVYSFRENLPISVVTRADQYCVPLFHQNWKLFAPDLPKYNVELEFRTNHGGEWSTWHDASAYHQFGSSSRIETVEQGFNNALNWQVLDNLYRQSGKVQYDRVVQSNAYASALYFVLKLEQLYHPETIADSIQLRLNYRFTPEPGAVYTPEVSYLEFPVYSPMK